MTITDLLLACRTLLDNNPAQTGCPVNRIVSNQDMELLHNALDGIPMADRLRWARSDEAGLPMAYKPVPGPPVNPLRLTFGPDDET